MRLHAAGLPSVQLRTRKSAGRLLETSPPDPYPIPPVDHPDELYGRIVQIHPSGHYAVSLHPLPLCRLLHDAQEGLADGRGSGDNVAAVKCPSQATISLLLFYFILFIIIIIFAGIILKIRGIYTPTDKID